MEIIKQSYKCTIANLDIANKIYNEKSEKIISFFGIIVFRRLYQKDEVIQDKKSIGYK